MDIPNYGYTKLWIWQVMDEINYGIDYNHLHRERRIIHVQATEESTCLS